MPQVSPFKRPVYYLFKLTYMWEALHLANITIMWLGVYYRSALNHEIRPLNHEIHPLEPRDTGAPSESSTDAPAPSELAADGPWWNGSTESVQVPPPPPKLVIERFSIGSFEW